MGCFGYVPPLALGPQLFAGAAVFFAAQGLVWLAVVMLRAAGGRLDRATATLPLLGYVVGGVLTLALYAPILPSVLATVGGVYLHSEEVQKAVGEYYNNQTLNQYPQQ